MVVTRTAPSSTKSRSVVKRRPSSSSYHRDSLPNSLSTSLRNSINNSIGDSLGDGTHSLSDSSSHSDDSDFSAIGAMDHEDSPPLHPRRWQHDGQQQQPRRRSSMDNGDMSPHLQQRRRSSLDSASMSVSSHQRSALASSLQGRSGGNLPVFRPPNVDHSSPVPFDAAALGNGSSHSIGSGGNDNPSNGGPPGPGSSSTPAGPARRTSMSDLEQAERRASIKQIMRDGRLSQLEKRRSIQQLMDGRSNARRSTIDCGVNPYLEAKLAAEAWGSREGVRRSNSFNNGHSEEEGEGDAASVGSRHAAIGGSDGQDDYLMTETPAPSNPAPTGTSMFAAFNQGFNSSTPPAANTPFDNSTAPWASFNGGSALGGGSFGAGSSFSTSFNAGPSFIDGSPAIAAASRFNGNDNDEYIHVPDHNPMAEAAIAAATSQTLSDHYQAKHPYKSNTTAVPAVAAEAYDAHPFMKAKRRNSAVEVCRRAIETAPPCTHYERNLHIVSPCCGATFGCRICHDDCPVLPPLLDHGQKYGYSEGGMANAGGGGGRKYQRVLRTSSMPTSFSSEPGPPEHHNVDRFAIREVICRECFTKQSSKTNFCINCNVQFGEYHCAICNLWMSNEERPYHCPDCGFCRVGGGENFRHCQDCGMCIDRQLFADHNCKVGKYMSNCPVCQEDLFSSRDASHELPCGHAIHWHCFRELAGHDSRCPMCKKTAETHERMKPTWDAMAMGIALQPVPPELCKVVTIKCNDCERVQEKRSWHFLGVQCRHCESFNTVVERITMMGQEAHGFLLRNEEGSGDGGGGDDVDGRRQEQVGLRQGVSGGGAGAAQPVPANSREDDVSPRARRRRRASMVAAVPYGGSNPTPPPPFG